jgi:hypothetical protein
MLADNEFWAWPRPMVAQSLQFLVDGKKDPGLAVRQRSPKLMLHQQVGEGHSGCASFEGAEVESHPSIGVRSTEGHVIAGLYAKADQG